MSRTNSKSATPAVDRMERGVATPLTLGMAVILVFAGGFSVWAMNSSIAGAVIAPGQLAVESHVKKVQHPNGGIIGAILVKNGDRVEEGQVLIRLDETQTRANNGVIVSQLVQLQGRAARLRAEQSGARTITFPDGFNSLSEEAPNILAGESRLFLSRLAARDGQKNQLRARVDQFNEEVRGLTAQRAAKDDELRLMAEELERMGELKKKDLLPTTRLLAVQRDLARLKGEWGALVADAARVQGQIGETELQMMSIDQANRSDAGKELRETEARISELTERHIASLDQLKRVELKSPQSGTVNDLAVHTIGGVIGPGDTLMKIVPLNDRIVVEARISPIDIDQVAIGQNCILRLTAFNQRTTPELNGTVEQIATDVTRDPETNVSYYTARIMIDNSEFARLDSDLKLVPGMPAEAFIETRSRTVASFLLRPLSDQLNRALREN